MARRKPRIGVALGAGSARGWAHIGVLRRLVEAGIAPEVVCGTSIGALVGAVYADDDLAQFEQWVKDLTWRKVVGYFDLSFGSGLLKGGKLFEYLRGDFLDKRIEDLPRPFGAVATDFASGREVWLRAGPVADAVRASIALPGLFTPSQDGDRLLVDGALVNPVPVSLARAMDADVVIAVDLSSDIVGQNSRKARKAGPPGMLEVVTGSLNIVSVRITRSRLAGEPADIVIRPRLGTLGLLEYHRGSEAIAEGRAAAELMIPQIQGLLQDWA
ncbi:MAG: patatin-like phospholipase family protein [Betaproteobacteria bacterium]|nr:patatin-like phospholipase family protein [Betaproteobacteria bacterium]